MDDIRGKVAIITGANSGIGKETAFALAQMGATVILACRNVKAASEVAEEIITKYPSSNVEVGPMLDLSSQESVRQFAEAINVSNKPVHILVNNAGMSYAKRWMTDQGVGGMAQTNYLGPYTLTRLLEKKLVESKARVVSVSSILHRTYWLKDARGFLMDWRQGYYPATKLANVLFAYELQRRLGAHGVQACASDPGGVRTNIYNASPLLSKGLYRTMIEMFYSPPSDGAISTIHAATVSWSKDQKKKDGSLKLPHEDLRYYARGVFATPLVTSMVPPRKDFISKLQYNLQGVLVLLCTTFFDWPLRSFSGSRINSKTINVKSTKQSYDVKLAAELWDVSAELAGLPKEPQL